jgi:hypothetical protein
MSQYAGPLAVDLGFFKKYGIDVEYSVFEGDAKAAAAIQAGQVQIVFTGVSFAVSSQLTDVPFAVVGVPAAILTDDLVCKAGIDTADEVKGKTIAISTFGGTSNASALIALKALKLAANDAVITQVGGQSARLAALGRLVDCAIIDSNLESGHDRSGLRHRGQAQGCGHRVWSVRYGSDERVREGESEHCARGGRFGPGSPEHHLD